MIKVIRFQYESISLTVLVQIWSMKKNEDAAAKKKPKTSAAQIRVQKGVLHPRISQLHQYLARTTNCLAKI